MEKLEKDILKTIRKTLINATLKDWKDGYVDDWAFYATGMRSSICSIVPILDTLLDQEDRKE